MKNSSLTKAIRVAIKSKGYTYRDIAKELGISASTVNTNIYRGNLRESTLVSYLKVIGMSFSEFQILLKSIEETNSFQEQSEKKESNSLENLSIVEEPKSESIYQKDQLDRIEKKLDKLLSIVKQLNT